MPTERGFTWIELLAALAVLSVALAIATPSLGSAVLRHRIHTDAVTLFRLVRLARQQAVQSGHRTVLCPLAIDHHCGRDWRATITLFSDDNRNGQLDTDERIVRQWSAQSRHSVIHWHGFGGGYLRYRPSGTAVENGTFDVCPTSGERRFARQVVINRVGRAYWSTDTDGDGIVEHGDDREPRCD